MQIIRNAHELKKQISPLKKQGKTIGFVPTMGALHEGHLSLIDIATKKSDVVIVSIFVNPAQFSENEDFGTYPRDEEDDLKKITHHNVDFVYMPRVEDIYPQGFDLKILTGELGQQLEGMARPHFFDGVALVVVKLFMQTCADVAIFGEKDFQQLTIIKNVVKALDLDVKIIGAPIIREKNGLAMSSRNQYLSAPQKQIAANLYKQISAVKNTLEAGEDVESAIDNARKSLLKSGFDKVNYIEIRNSDSLSKETRGAQNLRILAAAYLNGVRLLDNV